MRMATKLDKVGGCTTRIFLLSFDHVILQGNVKN